MTVDSTAAATVVTTRGRASVSLAYMAVSLRSMENLVLLGRTFLLAWRFSPLAGLKRSERHSSGAAHVGVNSAANPPDVPNHGPRLPLCLV